MRLAFSAEDNRGLDSVVSHHFGRCPYFVLVNVEDEEIGEVQVIDNPYYAQHQPGMVPDFIHDQNAVVMISGGMGRRAIAFFQQYDIATATGASGTVRTALKSYLSGNLSSTEPCRESIEHTRHHHGHDEGDDEGRNS
jgi:predicted Fe-Mo cluster-binding NifX family protein